MNFQRPKSKQPIPKNAQKVFSGVIFDVFQWKQKMYDNSYKTFEKLKRVDTVMIIPVTQNNKIIITEQQQPGKPKFFGLPGGRAESYNENPLSTASRELLEETGYKAQNYELFLSSQPISKIDWAIYVFIGKNCIKIKKQNLDSGEQIKLKFVNFDEFIKIVLTDDFQDYEIKEKILQAKINPKKMKNLKKILFD